MIQIGLSSTRINCLKYDFFPPFLYVYLILTYALIEPIFGMKLPCDNYAICSSVVLPSAIQVSSMLPVHFLMDTKLPNGYCF